MLGTVTTARGRRVRITHVDHFVLTVKSIPDTVAFYCDVLGMSEVTFGQGRVALTFGSQKINLHPAGNEYEPKATVPQPGSQDFCLITDTPLTDVIETLHRHNVDIIEGPGPRTGAVGPIESVYFRDPDGNLVEVSNYVT
jgi:catechol 2,3-dioxygenase-like lactoylglutathione lyase family enzyme